MVSLLQVCLPNVNTKNTGKMQILQTVFSDAKPFYQRWYIRIKNLTSIRIMKVR